MAFPLFCDPRNYYSPGIYQLPIFQTQSLIGPVSQVPLGLRSWGQAVAPEFVYELAANVLFSVVDWAKKLSTFNNLAENDKTCLLNLAWSELFALEASRGPITLYLQVFMFLNLRYIN